MTKIKKAFTLIEFAIVIVIIGMLVGGVSYGVSLIKSSRLASARSLSTKSGISEISGLIAWYETSMIDSLKAGESTTDASQISEWRDISPSSIVAQKNKLTCQLSNAITYKSSGINSIPSIQFSSSAGLKLAAFDKGNSAQNTIFIVMRPNSVSATMTLLDSYTALTTTSINVGSSQILINLGSSTAASTTFESGENYILAVYFNGNYSKAFINDAISATGSNALSAGSNVLSGLTIGSDKSGGGAFNGLISEIIIYDHALSVDERKAVMAYLSKKFNIRVVGV